MEPYWEPSKPELTVDNLGKQFRDKSNMIFVLEYLLYDAGQRTHFVVKYVHQKEHWKIPTNYWEYLI